MNWAPVSGYEKLYEVSDAGVIKRNGKILKPQECRNGYFQVFLCKNGEVRAYRVHRLVAKAFIENRFDKSEVNHIDGNKKNNRVENLEWVTRSENHIHAIRILCKKNPPNNFLGKRGAQHNRSKGFYVRFPDGLVAYFESSLLFEKETGINHTLISYPRSAGKQSHNFKKGKAKGYRVYFYNPINPHWQIGKER